MQTFSSLLLALGLFSEASAQLAAWPSQSYSPFYQALFGGASTPVLSAPVAKTAPSAIPLAAPALPVPVAAAPFFASPAPVLAAPAPLLAPPAPVFAAPRPVFAAPALAPVAPMAPVLRGPAFAYAPSPVLAPVGVAPVAPAPVFAAPAFAPVAPVLAAPRFVPAYAPFARAAMFIGSNKAKTA
ncbi:Intrinsically Disordered Protein, class C [Caenorhabditis elegans]|uniref:Intrinsically Disordered Protein, class C n=1 Tax=Caenorhabditis elegans TaxID=6239 RepID=Q22263_CAEEL|nr:Intrinsically Disordered Protein, class C [Caenorhabditis elegans]CAA94795.3 Intrinsically Disordered Protein, class C [Caenorhabditis elegans]|eukprot:NP_505481.2 Uncharacterized protein CELE_T06E4.9 [Caenorhabditis elegans]